MAENMQLLSSISRADQEQYGSFFALLGELAAAKAWKKHIPVGFVFSKDIYEAFIAHNKLAPHLKQVLAGVELYDYHSIKKASTALQQRISRGSFPAAVQKLFAEAYKQIASKQVVVRTSVAAADGVAAGSFRRFYGDLSSSKALSAIFKQAIVDHFSETTITEVLSKGYDYRSMPLVFLAQQQIAGDLSGEIMLPEGSTMTMRTRTGYHPENRYKGMYVFFKPGLIQGLSALIRREGPDALDVAEQEIVAGAKTWLALTNTVSGPIRASFIYEKKTSHWWLTGVEELVSVERPALHTYHLQKTSAVLASGRAVGRAIGQGQVVIASSLEKALQAEPGSVLLVGVTDVRFESAMRQAHAVISSEDTVDSHAARFCREWGIPCVIGVTKAKQIFKDKQAVTVSCAEGSKGYVYKGNLPFNAEPLSLPKKGTKTDVLVTITDTEAVDYAAQLPVSGVGLLAEETLFAKHIGIHPLALLETKRLLKQTKQAVKLFAGNEDPAEKAVRRIAEEIARVSVAFNGRNVLFRLSAADSVAYAELVGGKQFEQQEKNPLLGLRGAARFIDPSFAPAFALTCRALQRVRNEWGLGNVHILVPFCRTVEEGKQLLKVFASYGLEQQKNGLQVHVMCEIPANAILARDFIRLFDGFSIGLHNLTALTLGLDRSVFAETAYREEDRAIKQLVKEVIRVAHREGKPVSICDATPSEYPQFISFLVQEGIDSISALADRWDVVRDAIMAAEKRHAAGPHILPLRLASKAVSLAGFAGISMLLAGYTCQTVNLDVVKQDLQTTMEEELREHKAELERKLSNERAAELAARVERYHERGFADFSVVYPFGWQIQNQPNGVEFRSAVSSSTSWFAVHRAARKAMSEYDFTTTTTWLGNDVGWYEDEAIRRVVIFPNDKAFKEVIIIEGARDHFEAIWQSMTGFTWVPKVR